ncbi:hypothetical protein SFRURICE_005787 [Spodoptera frugiperda]|nr:hypothetical protein SFRURICE_005787 [Spodoptera frugiperda]
MKLECVRCSDWPARTNQPIRAPNAFSFGSNVSVHRPASYASYATDFSLPCIETYTTSSTDPHHTDRIISNTYMRCVLMTSYRMRTMRTMRAYGRFPLGSFETSN